MTAPRPASRPSDAAALSQQALDLSERGDIAAAERLYRRSMALEPSQLQIIGNKANLLAREKRFAAAIRFYRRGMAVQARAPVLYLMLGSAQVQSGDGDGGIRSLRRALDLQPGYPKAHFNLGAAFTLQRRWPDAERHYRAAIDADPSYADAYVALAETLREDFRTAPAKQAARRALVLAPAHAKAWQALALAILPEGQASLAHLSYRRGYAVAPQDAAYGQGYLYFLHFDPSVSPETIKAEHRKWGARFAKAVPAESVERPRRDDGRLRVGFISSDLRHHAVASFTLPVLAGRKGMGWDAYCYADVPVPDEMSRVLSENADAWRPIHGLADGEVARMIRRDGIDVLIDLNGHTAGNRLGVCARRAAPAQATWFGYPDTTGLPTMDYLLADDVIAPPDEDHRYIETVVRLRRGFACYHPPAWAPDIGPLPMLRNGYLTFGVSTQAIKITDTVLDQWTAVMRALPTSRLVIQAIGLGSPEVDRAFNDRFASRGVSSDRVALRGKVPYRNVFDFYRHVDLGLNTFPYGGGTSACESLWMGVPIAVEPANLLVGRHAESHLRNVGLPELVARDRGDLLRLIADIAASPDRLAQIRSALRSRMTASPLVDPKAFAIDFAEALAFMARGRR